MILIQYLGSKNAKITTRSRAKSYKLSKIVYLHLLLSLLPILLNPLHDVDEMGDIGKHEDRQADEGHHVDLANQIEKIYLVIMKLDWISSSFKSALNSQPDAKSGLHPRLASRSDTTTILQLPPAVH